MNTTTTQEMLDAIVNRTASLKDIKVTYPVLSECRTWAIAEAKAIEIHNSTVDAEEALEEEVSKLAEAEGVAMLSLRDQVKVEVLECMKAEASAAFRIATLVTEVKADFDTSDDFLKWCKEELGIGKASVYKYLKIATMFVGQEVFSTVAMRVLYELASYKHYKEIQDECESLATEGNLDSKSAMALIDAYNEKLNPKPVKKEEPEVTQTETGIPSSIPTLDEEEDNDDCPFDTTGSTTVSLTPAPVKEKEVETVLLSELEQMAKQLESLTKQLELANETIAELSKNNSRDVKVASAPVLPQFTNACLYARLGLGSIESKNKKAIKKSYRELVRIGYGEGHESHEAIKLAFTELTNNAEH